MMARPFGTFCCSLHTQAARIPKQACGRAPTRAVFACRLPLPPVQRSMAEQVAELEGALRTAHKSQRAWRDRALQVRGGRGLLGATQPALHHANDCMFQFPLLHRIMLGPLAVLHRPSTAESKMALRLSSTAELDHASGLLPVP